MKSDGSQSEQTPGGNSDGEEIDRSQSEQTPGENSDGEETDRLQSEQIPGENSDGEETDGSQTEPTPGKNSNTEEIISDDKLDRCITSMYKTLATVNDDRVKASSISNVPEQLKKSGAEAYMPKVVSIGPLHRGSRRELLYMEEKKWRCMLSLFQRTEEPVESHKKCSEGMFMLDDVVRATYADDIKFDAYDLAKIMLLDGCFLLELLISNNQQLLDSNPKYIKKKEPKKKSPGAEIGKKPLVLSDLKLLENQVPIFILIVLFQLLFDFAEEEFEDVRKIVNDSALILFGCNSNSIPAKSRPAHFLELLHCSMTGEEEAIDQDNNDYHSITVEPPKLQLERCATKLKAAGVKTKSLEAQCTSLASIKLVVGKKKINFGCDIKSERKLQIQPLYITETTEVLWRNLIAWEQNRIIHEKFLLEEENRTRCKFSQYALLFNDLVCCEHDIQLLKDRGVLLSVEDGDRRSNEDLMNLFRNVAKELQIDASGDVRFAQHIGAIGYCRIVWHLYRRIVTEIRYTIRYLYGILKRDHTTTPWKTLGVIAAIVLLGLTIAQTTLGAIAL